MKFNIGRLVRKRLELGLSQKNLAGISGLHVHDIVNLENRRVKSPKFLVISAIAKALGVSPEYFYSSLDEDEGVA